MFLPRTVIATDPISLPKILLILFLGRINFVKGLDLLIPAFAQVAKAFPTARLAIVGPDNDGYLSNVYQWCAEYGVQDQVFFVDILDRDEVIQAYVDANVFVLPSYTENFGVTVVEAMACQCPVVLSNQVNIWQQIVHEDAGIVVNLIPSEIADSISYLLKNKDRAQAMAIRGRLVAEKYYSWESIVEKLSVVYREVINEKNKKLY